jgi:hypothetical protein
LALSGFHSPTDCRKSERTSQSSCLDNSGSYPCPIGDGPPTPGSSSRRSSHGYRQDERLVYPWLTRGVDRPRRSPTAQWFEGSDRDVWICCRSFTGRRSRHDVLGSGTRCFGRFDVRETSALRALKAHADRRIGPRASGQRSGHELRKAAHVRGKAGNAEAGSRL